MQFVSEFRVIALALLAAVVFLMRLPRYGLARVAIVAGGAFIFAWFGMFWHATEGMARPTGESIVVGLIVGVVVGAIGWHVIGADERKYDDARATQIYRDGLSSKMVDRDRQRPSATWRTAWRNAGKPDDYPPQLWPRAD